MGLFSAPAPKRYLCKKCGHEFVEDLYYKEMELCMCCMSELRAWMDVGMAKIAEFQQKANAAKDPDEKIKYLTFMLNLLYDYKVNFADNDVKAIKEDIDDLIYEVVDCISYAREPD